MSKKTLILIFILLLTTGGLLYVALSQKKPAPPLPTTPPSKAAKPTPQEKQESILSLIPQTQTVSPNTPSTVNITINTGINTVTAVQLELSYDPKILSKVTVSPGVFLPNPIEFLNIIDKTNGKISYAIGISPTGRGKKGGGTIATIHFTALRSTQSKTAITFLETLVTAEEAFGSVLKKTNDATIVISGQRNSIPITSTSPIQ